MQNVRSQRSCRLQLRDRRGLIGAGCEVRQQASGIECGGHIGSQLAQNQCAPRSIQLAMQRNQLANRRTGHVPHATQDQHEPSNLIFLNQQVKVLPELLHVVVVGQLIPCHGDDVDPIPMEDGEEGRLEGEGIGHESARRKLS